MSHCFAATFYNSFLFCSIWGFAVLVTCPSALKTVWGSNVKVGWAQYFLCPRKSDNYRMFQRRMKSLKNPFKYPAGINILKTPLVDCLFTKFWGLFDIKIFFFCYYFSQMDQSKYFWLSLCIQLHTCRDWQIQTLLGNKRWKSRNINTQIESYHSFIHFEASVEILGLFPFH